MPAPLHGAASRNPAGRGSGKGLAAAQAVSGAAPRISCSSQGSTSALPTTAGSRAAQETPGNPHQPGGSPVPRLYGQAFHDLFGFLISILITMENAALVQNCSTPKPKALSVILGHSHHAQASAVPSSTRKGSHRTVWMFWGSVPAVIPVPPHGQAGMCLIIMEIQQCLPMNHNLLFPRLGVRGGEEVDLKGSQNTLLVF